MDPDLKRLQQEIASAVAGLSAEQMSWHPPGKWCAAEVLEHLYLTYTGTIKGFERVAAAGKPLAHGSNLGQRGRTLVVVGFGYLPSGREAPPVARPRGPAARRKCWPKSGQRSPRWMTRSDALRGEAGTREDNLLDHPILGPLTGGQWRKFHLVHGRHHVKQIRGCVRSMVSCKAAATDLLASGASPSPRLAMRAVPK